MLYDTFSGTPNDIVRQLTHFIALVSMRLWLWQT